MANKKIQATATLFLNTADAKKDAEKFVNDIKQKLKSIETAADKVDVFKDLVGYISQVDKALSALKAKNADTFNSMFDGIDTNLLKEIEKIFGTTKDQLTQLDQLRTKILNAKTNGATTDELKALEQQIKDLYVAAGKMDDLKLSGRGAFETRIKSMESALDSFALIWDEVNKKVQQGFSGIGGAGEGGGIPKLTDSAQKEIDKLEGKISNIKDLLRELDDAFKNAKNYSAGKDVALEYDLTEESARQLINTLRDLSGVKQKFDTGSLVTEKDYQDLIKYIKAATQLLALDTKMSDSGNRPKFLTDVLLGEFEGLFDFVESINKKFVNSISGALNKVVLDAQSKINAIRSDVSSYVNASTGGRGRSGGAGGSGGGDGDGAEITNIDFTSLESTIKSEVASLIDKLDSTLKVEIVKNDNKNIQSAIDSIKASIEQISSTIDKYYASINADPKQLAIDNMKSNLTQLLDITNKHNAGRSANGEYQRQELSASLLSDGSFSVNYGETGTVPWNQVAEQLVANLTKSLLGDIHTHPIHELFDTIDGETRNYVSDMFSGSSGDLGAFSFSKKLGAQIAGMLTGNILRVLDLSKLTPDDMRGIRTNLKSIEDRYVASGKYDNYIGKNKDGNMYYKRQSSLEGQHQVTKIFESMMYEAFQSIGFSQNKVDNEIFKKYNLTDDKQLTELAVRLVNLAASANQALSPIDRLTDIIMQFGGDALSKKADVLFDAYNKGEVSAADVFNELVPDHFVDQDAMNSLLSINAASQLSPVESMLSNISNILTTISGQVNSIELNTNKSTGDKLNSVINDLVSLKSGLVNDSMTKGIKSIYDPNNVTRYKYDDVTNSARAAVDDFISHLKQQEMGLPIADTNLEAMQVLVDKFKTAFTYVEDAEKQLKAFVDKSDDGEYRDPDTDEVLNAHKNLKQDLLDARNVLEPFLNMLSSARVDMDIDRAEYGSLYDDSHQTSKYIDNTGSIMSEVQQLNKLQIALDNISVAIDQKTRGFINEEAVVSNAVNTEVSALRQLYEELLQIVNVIDVINTNFAKTSDEVVKLSAFDTNNVQNTQAIHPDAINVNDQSISLEVNSLDNLLAKINEVRVAIDAKTQAFEQEYVTVDTAVDAEIASLQLLLEKLDSVLAKANLVNASLDKIGSNSIELNVNSSEEQLASLLTSSDIVKEISQLEQLQSKVIEVKNAVLSKTKAFVDEGNVVGQVVGKEISGLIKLEDIVNNISKKISELIQNITALNQHGINLNQNTDTTDVNTRTPEEQFKIDKTAQKGALTKYLETLKDVDYIAGDLRTKLDGLPDLLDFASSSKDLDKFKKILADVKKEVENARRGFEEREGRGISSRKNSLYNSFNSLDVNQQKALEAEFDEAIKKLQEYEAQIKQGKKIELDTLESTVKGIREKIKAQIELNKAAKNAEKTQKKNATFGDTAMINAKAKYNALDEAVHSKQFANSSAVMAAWDEYVDKYKELERVQNRLSQQPSITGDDEVEFKAAKDACNDYAKVLNKMLNDSIKLHSKKANETDYMLGSDFNYDDEKSRKEALADFAKTQYDVVLGTENFKKGFREAMFEVANGDGTVTKMTAKFTEARNEIVATAGDIKKVQGSFSNFIDGIKARIKSLSQFFIATISIYDVWRMVKTGIGYVRDIDSALTELKKVTNETDASYNKFLQDMAKTGSVIGATVKDLTAMAADWSKLGYSMEEAGKLAESTAVLLNVSEFDDANSASEALISTMQAFGHAADKSMYVVDVLNEVGNNYAITSDGIATALQDSASALMEGGNSLEQAVALVASANKVVQDPNSVGSALRTISLRLRGTSVEILEQMGEETEGVVESTSKLQAKIKALSGIDILTDSGAYKDTYTILREIGNVWEDMSDIDQAALLELMAGKNRANTLSAILSNMKDLEGAYNDALSAENSAMRENEAHLDSIQGRIDLFTNSIQTMWMNTIESDAVKWFVNLGTSLVKLADDIGVINIALTALAMRMSAKYFNVDFAQWFNVEKLRHPIKSIKDWFGTINNGAATAQKNLDALKKAYENAESAYHAKPQDQKRFEAYNTAKANFETYQKEAEDAIKASNDLREAQEHLANAQNKLNNYAGNSQKELYKLEDGVRRAQKRVEDATEANKKFEQSGSKAFTDVGKKAEKLVGQIQSVVASMLVMMLITHVVDKITDMFDNLNESAEEARQSFDDLTAKLDSTKSELQSLESELSNIESQIEEINQNTPLSFTDQEELDRLKAESEELRRQVEYTKILEKQQQLGVNQSAANAAEKYKETGKKTGKTASENIGDKAGSGALLGAGIGTVAVGSAAAGIGSAVLGAKAVGAIGTAIAPVIGTLIGAAIGALAGVIVGSVVGGIQNATDETIGETIGNMTENYKNLQSEMQAARDKYMKSGDTKDQEKYEEALTAFNNYQSEMATYMTEMDSMYSQMDWDTATEEQRRAMQEFYNQRDKWAIISGSKDAKANAIERLFGEDASEVVKVYRDKIENDIKNGKDVDFQEMIDVTGLDDDLNEVGLTVQDVADYFTELGEAGANAVEKIDFSDVVSDLAKIEESLGSMKSVMEEFETEGIVSASTLDGMQEKFSGYGEAWDNYVKTMMSGTASMWEAQKATVDLAKEYLEANVDDINSDTKLTYIAQLENMGVPNAKELVDSYANNDFWSSADIKSVTTEFSKLSDKISDAADAYDEIIEKDTTWSKGNVDYSNRPIVSPETMQEKYPEFDGDVATTYDQNMSILDSNGNIAYTVKVTPILEDGTVLDENTLYEYVEGKLQDAYNNGGIQGVLDEDKSGYNIVIATAVGEVEQEVGVLSELDVALQEAKDAHAELVNMSAQGLIDLAAEKGMVLELADAYNILQLAEAARNAETQYQNSLIKATTNKNNVEAQNAALLQKQQEALSAIENSTLQNAADSALQIYDHLTQAFSGSGVYANRSDEDLAKIINNLKTNLNKDLTTIGGGYTWEDLFPALAEAPSVEVDPDVVASKQKWDEAEKKYQEFCDGMNLTVTPEINFNENNALEETAKVEEAFAKLGEAYEEFKEHGIVDATSLVELQKNFKNVDGFEEFINILGDSTSTIEEASDAIQGLANGFLNDFDYSKLFNVDGDLITSEVQRVASQLENIGVANANELITQKAYAYNEVKKMYGIDLTNYENAEQAKTGLLAQALGKSVDMTGEALIDKLADQYDIDLNNFTGAWETKVERAKAAALEIARANAQAQLAKLDEKYSPEFYDATTNSESLKKEFQYLREKRRIETDLANAEAAINAIDTNLGDDGGYIIEYYKPTDIDPTLLGGNDNSGGSDSASEFEETLDWVEIRLEEINEQIDLMNAKLENVASYAEKNNIIDSMIGVNKTKMANLLAGIQKYSEHAAKLLAQVPAQYRDVAQNGAIAISEFTNEADKQTVEAIQNYREWAQKVSDLQQELEGVKTELRDLAIQSIDNVKDYGSAKTSIEDAQTEKLQNRVDLDEAMGEITSPAYYEAMMENSGKKIEYWKPLLENMQKEFDKAVEDGQIKVGSIEWYEQLAKLYEVQAEIDAATIELEEFQNSINDIYWDNFDQLINRIEYLKDETQSLIDLMDHEDMVITPETEDGWGADDVKWTDEGLASLGLYAQQMEIAEFEARQYAEAIDQLTADYEDGKYSENEYLEKLNELKSAQYDAIDAYNDSKEAIVDLNKARIDAIKEGIEKEIDAYSELIEKQKEALDAEKDLHDFQKSVMDQQKDIADLERQLAALAGDNSASARAKRAKLEAELAEANADLEETYYDRSVSNQQEALDKELENFKEEKEKEMEDLELYLENVEQVVADSLMTVQANATTVYDTLNAKADEYNLNLSESILSPWKDGSLAVSDYQSTFDSSMSSTMDQLDALKAKWQEVIDTMQEAAKVDVNNINATNANYADAKEIQNTTDDQQQQQIQDTTTEDEEPQKPSLTKGSYIEVKSGTKWYADSYGGGASGNAKSGTIKYINESGSHPYNIDGLGWVKKTDIKGYAKGTKNLDKSGIINVDELGEELVLRAHNGRLTYMEKGSGVIPADLTANLMEWGRLDPSIMLDSNRPKVNVHPEIRNTEIRLDCSVGTLLHIDEFNGDNPEDIAKLVAKEFDKHTKNLNNALRKYAR